VSKVVFLEVPKEPLLTTLTRRRLEASDLPGTRIPPRRYPACPHSVHGWCPRSRD